MPDNTVYTVKLEIEVGDIEIQFEGPTDFARQDLLPLIRGLVETLSELDDDLEIDDDEDDEEKNTKDDAATEGEADQKASVDST